MFEENSIEKCCRVCATISLNVNSLFDIGEDETRFIDMLEYCLQQPLDTHDYFPSYICLDCTTNLKKTHEFFVLYKKSEAFFLTQHRCIVNKQQSKVEIVYANENHENDLKSEFNNDFDETNDHFDELLMDCDIKSEEDDESENKILSPSKRQRKKKRKQITLNVSHDKVYACTYCPKTFNYQVSWKRHILVHIGKRNHSCKVCGKKFILKDHLVKHES